MPPAAQRLLQLRAVLGALRAGWLPLGRIIDVSPVRCVRGAEVRFVVACRVRK